MASRVSGSKIKKSEAVKIMKSEEVKGMLKDEADRIADAMTSESNGEFRSGIGTRGKTRAHAFVNTYSNKAKKTANDNPGIFAQYI